MSLRCAIEKMVLGFNNYKSDDKFKDVIKSALLARHDCFDTKQFVIREFYNGSL
jgi:hypothetical protein